MKKKKTKKNGFCLAKNTEHKAMSSNCNKADFDQTLVRREDGQDFPTVKAEK